MRTPEGFYICENDSFMRVDLRCVCHWQDLDSRQPRPLIVFSKQKCRADAGHSSLRALKTQLGGKKHPLGDRPSMWGDIATR